MQSTLFNSLNANYRSALGVIFSTFTHFVYCAIMHLEVMKSGNNRVISIITSEFAILFYSRSQNKFLFHCNRTVVKPIARKTKLTHSLP